MKKVVILIICIICIVGCSNKESQKIDFKTITSEQAYEMMNTEENIVILDVRTNSEYETGHIENAINIPLNEIENSIKDLVSDKTKTILVYCQSGTRSKQASEKLTKLGYTNVNNFGGLNTWKYEITQ